MCVGLLLIQYQIYFYYVINILNTNKIANYFAVKPLSQLKRNPFILGTKLQCMSKS